jgi:hypothetical protein
MNVFEAAETISNKDKNLKSSQFTGLLLDYCNDTIENKNLATKIGPIISKYKIFELIKKQPNEDQLEAILQAAQTLGDDLNDMNIALDVVSIYYGLMTYEDINTEANNEVSEEEIDLNTNNELNEDGITILDSSKLYDPSLDLDFTYGGTAFNYLSWILKNEAMISIITGKPLQNDKDYSDVFAFSYLLSKGTLVLAIKTGLFNKFEHNYITIPSISKDENHVFFSGAYNYNNTHIYTSITNKGRAFVFEIKNGKISTLPLTEFKVKDNEIVNDVLNDGYSVYVTTNERMIRSGQYTSDKKITFYDTHERKCKKNTTKSGFIQDTYKNSRNYFYELTDDNSLYFLELYPYNMPINKLGVKLDINENVFNGAGVTKYVLFTRHNVYIIDEKGMMFGDLYLVKEAFGVDLKLENDEIIYGISDEVLANSLSVHIMTNLRVIYIKDYVVIESYYEDHKLAIDNEYLLNRIMSFGGRYLIESVKEK